MKKRILLFVLMLALAAALLSCSQKTEDAHTEPMEVPENVRIYTLNGTTGFGFAKMMSDYRLPDSYYQFTVRSDVSDVTAALISGDADIAALPTNAAANVYNVTGGQVEVLAINTGGCLYLLTREGVTVSSFADLRGKTVYVPAQNPTFIFHYLCRQNGLEPGTDIIVNSTSYASPANLRDAVAAGKVEIAVLPEPMVTIAKVAANQNGVNVNVTLDLNSEWDRHSTPGSLVQGCVVVRREFAERFPYAVTNFLTEYEKSIAYLDSNLDDASRKIAETGILSNADVAKIALPKCNVCFLTGSEMKTAMKAYLEILYSVKPASIGNALPADDFYYGV